MNVNSFVHHHYNNKLTEYTVNNCTHYKTKTSSQVHL